MVIRFTPGALHYADVLLHACFQHPPLLHEVIQAVGRPHGLQTLCQVPVLLGMRLLDLPLKGMGIPACQVRLNIKLGSQDGILGDAYTARLLG